MGREDGGTSHTRIPPWVAPVVAAGELAVLLWLEARYPLRRPSEDKAVRDARNLVLGAIGALPTVVIESPLITRLGQTVVARRWGLLGRLRRYPVVATIVAIVLLDYTMYFWHVLAHRVPVLWRFHLVHHVDRDLDVTTALRFHVGEMTLSIGWRAVQMLVIGASPFAYELWQLFLVCSILFHHSNVRLPAILERRLAWLVVTPSLHGIHHAERADLQNANWSSGLTCWDRLHRTLRDDVPQDQLRIGVPGYNTDRDAALGTAIVLPFTALRKPW